MPLRLAYDCETNGLLDTLDTVHCIVLHNLDNGSTNAFHTPRELRIALRLLEEADLRIAHNALGFDELALKKVYPNWNPKGTVRDTLVMSRLIYADMAERDFAWRRKHPKFDAKLIGRHSLEAWGQRLGYPKDDYAARCKAAGIDPWANWSQEMQDYCVIDVEVLVKLWEKLEAQGFSEESIVLEHDVARIILAQEARGWTFDTDAALKLQAKLEIRHAELTQELASAFPPWEVKLPDFIPKRDNKAKGYKAGVPVPKSKTIVFNPASRDHIAHCLTAKYGWKPAKFTDGGKPAVDEVVLSKLKYPEARRLSEYLLVEKRLGQIATGKHAWLKSVQDDGRIHGRVNSNGAVTGRMTHSNPNVAQVPRVGSPYGAECRALFTAAPGLKLVGCDASGLELRMLAHYMARYDDGAYCETVVNGNKEDGTDIHTVNQKAAGLSDRDTAKTFIYALLYGAGDAKIGSIIGKGAKAGKQLKERFFKNLPALGKLMAAVQKAAQRGHLIGLDGRKLYVRSAHAALNTLLQSAGALVMKRALVLLDDFIRIEPRFNGSAWFVGNIHDEIQTECEPDIANEIGELAKLCITHAGEHFGLRCKLDGEYAVGVNWRDTH